jgi:hypothetical protein
MFPRILAAFFIVLLAGCVQTPTPTAVYILPENLPSRWSQYEQQAQVDMTQLAQDSAPDPMELPDNNNQPSLQSGCPSGCDYHKAGCDIKGNISFDTQEKIYHVPGNEFYNATVINKAYGERWFCTEDEARNNGWRKAVSQP